METSSGRNRPVAAVSRSSGPRCARPTGRSEQRTRRLGALCLAERDLRDPAYQLRIVPAGDLRHAGAPRGGVQVGSGADLGHPTPPRPVDWELEAPLDTAMLRAPAELADRAEPGARRDLRSLRREPRSRPARASSAAGLTMAGSGKSSSILPCAPVQRGTGSPACWSKTFAMGLRRHAARVQRLAPVRGIPAN